MPAVRRLVAILAADVAGYSRLMGADEEGTHQRLQAHLRDLIDPKIAKHHGHVVKNTGDGFLAQFPSVVNAVRCAVEVQRGTLERNAGTPPEKRIEFRVGINIGDVIVEGGDIFGDGVNVAARLEGLAEPGGVCVSGVVRDQIRDKLPYPFEDRGEQSVKNIATPVHAFALSAAAVARTPLVPVDPSGSAVVTKASSLPEEFSLQSVIGAQITAYTVDATLIDKGTPGAETVSDRSGKTYTVPTSTYIFAFDNGRHYPIKLTILTFPLPLV
jgi:class 3 adenylate cyclase